MQKAALHQALYRVPDNPGPLNYRAQTAKPPTDAKCHVGNSRVRHVEGSLAVLIGRRTPSHLEAGVSRVLLEG
jgi:hypothetical protein